MLDPVIEEVLHRGRGGFQSLVSTAIYIGADELKQKVESLKK